MHGDTAGASHPAGPVSPPPPGGVLGAHTSHSSPGGTLGEIEVWRDLQAGEGLPAGSRKSRLETEAWELPSRRAGVGGEGCCWMRKQGPSFQGSQLSSALWGSKELYFSPTLFLLWDKAWVYWASQAGSTESQLLPPPCGAVSDPSGQDSTAAGWIGPSLPGGIVRSTCIYPEPWDVSDGTRLRSSWFPTSPQLIYLWPYLREVSMPILHDTCRSDPFCRPGRQGQSHSDLARASSGPAT